jgi:hypothetical protein
MMGYNAAGGVSKYVAAEASGALVGGSEMYLMYDAAGPSIIMSGSIAGSTPVGANYRGQNYRLVVHY